MIYLVESVGSRWMSTRRELENTSLVACPTKMSPAAPLRPGVVDTVSVSVFTTVSEVDFDLLPEYVPFIPKLYFSPIYINGIYWVTIACSQSNNVFASPKPNLKSAVIPPCTVEVLLLVFVKVEPLVADTVEAPPGALRRI